MTDKNLGAGARNAADDSTTAAKLAWLGAYSFEYLRELYEEDCPGTAAPFEDAVREFRRFVELIVVQDGPLAVTDKSADRLWHTLVVHTEDYSEFCARLEGGPIEHRPHSARRPVPSFAIANTFEQYEARFGPPPDSWLPGCFLTREAIASRKIPMTLDIRWSGWPGRG